MPWTRASASGPSPSARCAHATDVCGSNKLFIFGGWNGTRMLNDLQIFYTDPMTWSKPITTGNAPGCRAGHTMTAVDTKLYVFGGGDGSQYLNDLHILDTETMAWSQAYVAGTSPAARSRHTATLIGTRLFVFGGGDDSRVYNDLYVLDTTTMSWTRPATKGTPPVARWGHTCTLIGDGKLLVFGGHDGSKMLNDINILDITTMTWSNPINPAKLIPLTSASSPSSSSSTSSSSPSSPALPSAAPSIPASGLDPNANSMALCPSSRAGHTATLVSERKLLMFGGGDGAKILNDTWLLDLTTFTWSRPQIAGNAPPGRCAHTATLHEGNKLIVFGGGDGGRRFKDLYILDTDAVLKSDEASKIAPKTSKAAKKSLKKRGGSSQPKTQEERIKDITLWLTRINMAQYAEKFIAQEIDMETISFLTESNLEQLGIATLGARIRILNAIKEYKAALEEADMSSSRDSLPSLPVTSNSSSINNNNNNNNNNIGTSNNTNSIINNSGLSTNDPLFEFAQTLKDSIDSLATSTKCLYDLLKSFYMPHMPDASHHYYAAAAPATLPPTHFPPPTSSHPPATLPHMGVAALQQVHAVTAQHPLTPHAPHSPQQGRKPTNLPSAQPQQQQQSDVAPAALKTNNPMSISMPTPQHPPTQ